MRRVMILSCLFLSACSTSPKVQGTYFTENQDCFVLDGKYGIVESKENGIVSNLTLRQTEGKLKFYLSRRWRPPLSMLKRRTDKYYFRLLQRKGDSLIVAPESGQAKAFFNNKSYLVFTTKTHFADQTNYFHKIIFHSSRCFGYCKDLHLQLDYSGNLKVTNNGDGTGDDTARNDNYFGRVSYKDLDSLRSILKYSQLKTLVWPANRRCVDLPDFTLILYQYDKRYYFHINAGCQPIVSAELTSFLYKLYNYPTLHKVDTTFTYER